MIEYIIKGNVYYSKELIDPLVIVQVIGNRRMVVTVTINHSNQ